MTTITNHTEYTAAVNEAKLHDYRYFTLNAPTISDEEYDRIAQIFLERLEEDEDFDDEEEDSILSETEDFFSFAEETFLPSLNRMGHHSTRPNVIE